MGGHVAATFGDAHLALIVTALDHGPLPTDEVAATRTE